MKETLSIDWESAMRNKKLDEQWKFFTEKVNEAIQKHIPRKKSSANKPSKKHGIQLSKKLNEKKRKIME